MIWLPRSLWLLAWSFWAWLGWGLYRELPRDLGPVLCRVAVHSREYPSGFVGGKPVVAVREFDASGDNYYWHLVDAKTGERHSKVFRAPPVWNQSEFSPGLRFLQMDWLPSDQCETVTASGVPKSSKAAASKWPRRYVVDFTSGRTLIVTSKTEGPIYHPSKPWAAFWSGPGKLGDECYVTVLDLTTGARLFTWTDLDPVENRLRLASPPFFVGADRVAVPIHDGGPPFRIANWRIEIWTIPPRGSPADEIRGKGVGFAALAIGEAVQRRGNGGLSPPAKDRIAWHWRHNGKLGFDVFDLREKRSLMSAAIDEGPQPSTRGVWAHYGPPVLSRDGETVLSPILYQLHGLAPERLIWAAGENELVTAVDEGDRFEVREAWKVSVGGWSKEFQTFAIRRLRDAGLECRAWQPTLASRCMTDDGRTLALLKANVYELPLHVNYPLLALCQSILALPLLLLWSVLHWRRRRKSQSIAAMATPRP